MKELSVEWPHPVVFVNGPRPNTVNPGQFMEPFGDGWNCSRLERGIVELIDVDVLRRSRQMVPVGFGFTWDEIWLVDDILSANNVEPTIPGKATLNREDEAQYALQISEMFGAQPSEEPLSERAQLVLVAMHELDAVDSDRRRPTEKIAVKALGQSTDANALKSVMADLRNRKLIDSKTGRGGGCWLTESGRLRAEKLRHP